MLIIPGLLLPAFSRIYVDDVIVGGLEDWLGPLVLAMGLTIGLLLVLTGLQQYVLFRLGQRLQLTASGRFFWHVLRLPVAFFDMRYTADVSSRASSTTASPSCCRRASRRTS